MIRYKSQSEAELQKSLDETLATVKAEIDSQVTPGFPGAMATVVKIFHQSTLPFVSPRVWLFTPRRWVGFTGLTCCLIIAGLWIYSSFVSSIAVSGGYSRSGMDEAPQDSSATGKMLINRTDTPISNSSLIQLDNRK